MIYQMIKWYVHVFGKDFTNPEQDYTELFILHVEVDSALTNSSIATALNIRCCDLRYITFCDDGSPLTSLELQEEVYISFQVSHHTT